MGIALLILIGVAVFVVAGLLARHDRRDRHPGTDARGYYVGNGDSGDGFNGHHSAGHHSTGHHGGHDSGSGGHGGGDAGGHGGH